MLLKETKDTLLKIFSNPCRGFISGHNMKEKKVRGAELSSALG